MSIKQFPGGIITKNPTAPAGPYENGAAPGVWTLEQQLQYQKQGIWPTAGLLPNYIEDYLYTYLRPAQGGSITYSLPSGVDLYNKGGIVWVKSRSAAQSHAVMNPNFKAAGGKSLQSNSTAAFDVYGTAEFAVNSGNTITMASGNINDGSYTYVDWTFVKQAKFFDVVTYTGTGSNRTIAHSLGSVPGSIIIKRTDTAANWAVYHRSLANTQYLVLNANDQAATGATWWNSTTPTSAVFSLGTDASVNASGGTYVAYIYAHDAGGFGLTGTDNVISCGSYTGNGSSSGPIVNLGYEPQWIIIKNLTSSLSWEMYDNMRGVATGGNDNTLYCNASTAEQTSSNILSFTATGFQITNAFGNTNGDGSNYIYIAIRRGPMKVPTLGTSVFNTLAHTGDAGGIEVTGVGFPPDLLISKCRQSQEGVFLDRLRGTGRTLFSNGASAEDDNSFYIGALGQDGVKTTTAQNAIYNRIGFTNAWWFMKRAPSFFDEVCYTGTGSNRTVTHNLGVAPELIICKGRSLAENWISGSTALANTEYLIFNEPAAKATGATYWNSTYPTSSVFSLGTASEVNNSGSTFVAYLFASCAGVSKVGSYTGNGSTQTINCGFGAGGVRFVMIKRTNAIGDWYVYDTARGMTVLTDPYLLINTNAGEVDTLGSVTTVSTGFALNSTILAAINVSGGSYIFLAIA